MNCSLFHVISLTSVLLTLPVLAVDFDTDLMPVFARAGCNAGSCHGSAAGRGGFKLSLLGGDPAGDYETIVKEFEGRRINLARPDESLLLAKPTGLLDHGGDIRLDMYGPGATLLESWIKAGAPRLKQRELESFKVSPAHHLAGKSGEKVQLRAMAYFSDGLERDVTDWTVFTSNDPSSLAMSEEVAGEATVLRPGQNVVVARYLSQVVSVRITVPIGDNDVSLSAESATNPIDRYIYETLETLRLKPRPPSSDATFLRRTSLVLTGTLPGVDRVRGFLKDSTTEKRSHLIEELLKSGEFIDYWTFRFATLLRIRSLPNDTEVARAYQKWVREKLSTETSYAKMAGTLITATGDSHKHGEAAFSRMTGDARTQAEFVSEVFMGSRLRCANCHNHPLDHWTQDDYHGLAAIFARIDRGRVVKLNAQGEVTHPRTGKPAIPRLPGERFLSDESVPLSELATWLTGEDNPYFARSMVNRLWAWLMGRGLVEPVDDHRSTNPATHPPLLDFLAEDFRDHGFSLRHTIGLIARSEAFARGLKSRDSSYVDDRFYSHSLLQPLDAEILADAISQVTGVWDEYGAFPERTRAIQLPDPKIPSTALDILGRCRREESCESSLEKPGLAAKLHLLNGPLINQKITSSHGRLAGSIARDQTNAEIVEEFYLRCLSRFPRGEEREYWGEHLDSLEGDERVHGLEDFLWSLLTCKEFRTIH